MSWLDNATNYGNFEGFVPENTVNRFKLISPKQARILTNEHPWHMYGTNTYQWTKLWAKEKFELCPRFLWYLLTSIPYHVTGCCKRRIERSKRIDIQRFQWRHSSHVGVSINNETATILVFLWQVSSLFVFVLSTFLPMTSRISIGIFPDIAADTTLFHNKGFIMLPGDFNARTGEWMNEWKIQLNLILLISRDW